MPNAEGPTTAADFMALPVGDRLDERAVAFFMPEDLIMSLVADGKCWMLQRLNTGEWQRVMT